MRWGALGRWMLAATWAGLATQVCAGEPLTTTQMEALPKQQAERRVRSDMMSVLKPSGPIESGTFRRLRAVGFETRPYGTAYAGICRMDLVSLLYAPLSEKARPEDQPLRPQGIEAWPLYRVTGPVASPAEEDDEPRDAWRADCVRLKGSDPYARDGWFSAPDLFSAAQGVIVLERAVAAVRAGILKSGPCDLPLLKGETCEGAILAFGSLEKLVRIELCARQEGEICYVVDLDGMTLLTIKGRGDRTTLEPTAIESIAVEQYITVT